MDKKNLAKISEILTYFHNLALRLLLLIIDQKLKMSVYIVTKKC